MKIRLSQTTKRKIAPYRNSVKRDIRETYRYYSRNAIDGWNNGRMYAQSRNYGVASEFFIKSAGAVTNTKIRGKDVLPLLGCGIFSISNPFIGMGLVGFALGKSINKLFTRLVKGINKANSEFMPKNPLHTNLDVKNIDSLK